MKFYNKALRILLFTNALILLSAAMLGPIYALFVEEVGGNLLDASVAGGLFAVAAGVTTFLFGKMSDRVRGGHYLISIGYAVMGLGFLLYVWVDSIWMLFAIQCLIGFGEALYSPSFDKLYSEHLAKNKSGEQWGAWEAMNYFMLASGAFLGGLIAHYLGFNALFIAMASLCCLSALYLAFLPQNKLV